MNRKSIIDNPIGSLSKMTNPLSIRLACEMSQSEMGRRLGEVHPNGHQGRAYGRAAISHWENGRFSMNDDVKESYRRVIAGQVSKYTNGLVSEMEAKYTRRFWTFTAKAECKCKRWYRPKRKNQVRCPRCIKAGKR